MSDDLMTVVREIRDQAVIEMYNEAADEIAVLNDVIETLRAENARLRAASVAVSGKSRNNGDMLLP